MSALTGRTAFITGASSGIGAAVAKALAGEGVRQGLISRSPVGLDLPNSMEIACDVRDREQVQAAVDRTGDHFGGIDIVVANAGVGSWGPFEQTPWDEVKEMVDVNVLGLFNTVHAALPWLKASGSADLVTVASEAGRRGLPDEAVYVATKFAQVGFTRALDHELRQIGIRCSNVCPGGVATSFGMGRGLRTPDMPELADMMRPEDVADVVLFVLKRPRHYRILETAFRAVTEASWG